MLHRACPNNLTAFLAGYYALIRTANRLVKFLTTKVKLGKRNTSRTVVLNILEHEYEIVVAFAPMAGAPNGNGRGGDIDSGVLHACAQIRRRLHDEFPLELLREVAHSLRGSPWNKNNVFFRLTGQVFHLGLELIGNLGNASPTWDRSVGMGPDL